MAQDPVQLLAQADKAYSGAGSGFSFFGSRTEKYENAAELYIKAASAYRAKRAMREAGMAYEKAATIQGTKLSEPDDMANTLQDAFKVYREQHADDAARCLSQAIEHYVSKGNYRRAATQKQILAELYEKNGDRVNARSTFAEAAQWFEDDNASALANKLHLKAAEFAALDSDYLDAIKRYENVAQQSVSNNLMRFSVPKYLLNAGICHLALDIIGAKRALESYRELDPHFPSSGEGQFLADISEAMEQGDSEAFEDGCLKFARRTSTTTNPEMLKMPEQWHHTVLTRIKNQLKEKEEDFS